MEKISVIYSQPSIAEVKKLINTFLFTFKIYDLDANDMFYFGVFCAPETYANYPWYIFQNASNFEIPEELSAPCSNSESRIEYVKVIMNDIIKNKLPKPEWMLFIENITDSFCGVQSSNFLYLLPKKEEYKNIGEQLIEFLYSPNRTTYFKL